MAHEEPALMQHKGRILSDTCCANLTQDHLAMALAVNDFDRIGLVVDEQ
jgi:hypothetical protein